MKTVVVLSGGLDSTVLLFKMLEERDTLRRNGLEGEVMALSVMYGQRHRKELDYARRTTHKLKLDHLVLDLSSLAPALAGSALTSDEITMPHGHYAAESMKATVVPNRNMLLLAIAGSAAISHKMGRIAYGAHAGDHTIYPDCRPEFVAAMSEALKLADWKPIHISAPFLSKTKADIVKEGSLLGVPFRDTWSCYSGGELHCGLCGTCVERREAFSVAGVPDPTEYEPAAPARSR